MIQVVWVEVMVRLARHCRLVFQPFTALQDVVDLESGVIDLGKPLHWHVFREHPSVTTSFREVEDHVLNKRPAIQIVVLKGRPLIQKFVVLASSTATIKSVPL